LGAGNTTISVYYGNSSVSSGENMKGVWNDNYVMVHHMQEDPTTTCSGANEICDSTSNGYHGDASGTLTSVNGKVGPAITFPGSNDFFALGSFDPPQIGTVEFWVNFNSGLTDGLRVMGGDDAYEARIDDDIGNVYMSNQFFHGGSETLSALTPFTYETWKHIVMTYNFSTSIGEIFIDGNSDNSDNIADDDPGTDNFCIGERCSSDPDMDGELDEIRISSLVRTDDWIAFEFCNMTGRCNTYGSEESAPSNNQPTINSATDSPDPVGVGSNITFSVTLFRLMLYFMSRTAVGFNSIAMAFFMGEFLANTIGNGPTPAKKAPTISPG